jgi:WD40 repeat protein
MPVTIAAILAIIFGGQATINASRADQNAAQAQTNLTIAQANAATAQAEAQIRATQQALAESNFNRAEAQRLALEANRLLSSGGSSEQIALLSLRSMNTQYTLEGDAALAAAARLDYPVKSYNQAGPVWSARFSPDGKYILVGDDYKTVKLWDARSGQELRRFTGHKGRFSPDGKYILTESFGESIGMWDAATGQEVYQITTNTSIYGVFARWQDYIDEFQDTIRRWDAASGKELGVFLETPERVWTMAISPDDRYLLTTSNSTAQLWDLQTGQEIREFPFNRSHIDFSPDGNFLVSESPDGKAHLWDVKTGQEARTFIGLPHLL